jgi:uncharacterized membrane protein YkvA (DUF1232 family)
MFERFRIVPQLWRSGRLALRLVRDPRVPLAAKAIFFATAIYIVSPIDVIPDWFPFVGQADDVLALLAGLNLFLRACPQWIVEEHEDTLAGRRDDTLAGDRRGTDEYGSGRPVDARYERVR